MLDSKSDCSNWLYFLYNLNYIYEILTKNSAFYIDLCFQNDEITVSQIPSVIDKLIIKEQNKSESSQNKIYISDNLSIQKAIHPTYAKYETRLDSFKEWPSILSQHSSDLANSGFFYKDDEVKCFFCNCCLRNWSHNDDSYENHIRFYPKCQYMYHLMGTEFIEQVLDKNQNKDFEFESNSIIKKILPSIKKQLYPKNNDKKFQSNSFYDSQCSSNETFEPASFDDIKLSKISSLIFEQDEIKTSTEVINNLDNDHRIFSHSYEKSPTNKENNRLETMKNCNFLIDPKDLASNGLYLVKKNEYKMISNRNNDIPLCCIPDLNHLKCEYCNYECFVPNQSDLNHNFISPIEEHYQKSVKKCPLLRKKESINENKNNFELPHFLFEANQSVSREVHPEYKLFNARLKSFAKCPLKIAHQAEVLADAGFFFSAETKKIQCFECNVCLGNCNQRDDPLNYHLKLVPKCQFIQLKKHVKVIQKADNKTITSCIKPSELNISCEQYQQYNNWKKRSELEEFSIKTSYNEHLNLDFSTYFTKEPHNAWYCTNESRLKSFKKWPLTFSNEIRSDLAKAGFYYSGVNDIVKCFFCDGEMKNLNININPFKDHAKLYPKCQYIQKLCSQRLGKTCEYDIYKFISDFIISYLKPSIGISELKEFFHNNYSISPKYIR